MRFVQLADKKRPGGAGAVDLVADGWTGTEHPGSVAGLGYDVEGELDRRSRRIMRTSMRSTFRRQSMSRNGKHQGHPTTNVHLESTAARE